MRVHDVCSGRVHGENIVWQSLKQGVTHRRALNHTHYVLLVLLHENNTHSISTLCSFSGSNHCSQYKAIHFCYCTPLSSIRNEGTQVFLLHIWAFLPSIFENLTEKSWLCKTHNCSEWESQKDGNQLCPYENTLIHQIGVCHTISDVGIEFVHGVALSSNLSWGGSGLLDPWS